MNSLNSLKLAELRQHELRADAACARLAGETGDPHAATRHHLVTS